jgi:hypothetical protein
MTSRLYPTTRRLFGQVFRSLTRLGLGATLSPLSFALTALYITGLVLLDRRQNGERMAAWLPARAHDALNRLLRVGPFSSRRVMNCLIAWAKVIGRGYLVIDDVVVEKPFSRTCAWIGWTYSTSQRRKLFGFHVVVLLWCSGGWRLPVAFRLWRPKAHCAPRQYRKKSQLAWEMVVEVVQAGLPFDYVTMDYLYTGSWFTKKLQRLPVTWIGVLHPKTLVCYRQRRWQAAHLFADLKLKWRTRLDLRARSIVAYLPKYGTLRLVGTRNRHGNCEVLATNALDSDLTTIVLRKRSRWSVESLFRDAKQFAGLAACQCRVDRTLVRHVTLVLLAFVVLQRLRRYPKETLGAVKDRLQRDVFTAGMPVPQTLKGKVAISQLLTA